MYIYEAGLWEDLLVNSGIKKVIQMVQLYYLNSYECFLIRKILSDTVTAFQKQQYRELLKLYYKFIGCFYVAPYVKERHDNAVLYNEDDERRDSGLEEYTIEEDFLPLYDRVVGKMTRSESNAMKKEVLDIIKRNSLKNVEDMNKKLLDLFNMDQGFKETILAYS